MDIEGFVRARIDDYDYNDLAEILAVRIREYSFSFSSSISFATIFSIEERAIR